MKLTTTSIAGLVLPPGKSDAIFWDDAIPGFGIRLRRAAASCGSSVPHRSPAAADDHRARVCDECC